MTSAVTYTAAAAMPFADVLNRYQQLNDRDSMARAISTLKARGEWNADRSLDPADYPPLSTAEHLELLALGEVIAFHYRHPATVHHAVLAGAGWDEIAAATGEAPDEARRAYLAWAEGQHRTRLDFPGGTIGLGDEEYAAAVKAAGDPGPDPAEAARRLEAIREVLARFDWERDDRQHALEAIERIADGGTR